MMDPQSSQPNPGTPRELNLQRSAEQFMIGMQRHFDMLAFNLAARQTVTEESYQAKVQEPAMLLVPQFHQNFEQMQAHSRDLLFTQAINDNLQLAVACLNQVHLFLALIKAQKENGGLPPKIQHEVQQKQGDFLRLPLEQKFNLLEEKYGVMSELEDGITSLGMAFQALSRQGGVVKEDQLDEQKELVIEFKKAPDFSSEMELGAKLREMVTVTKTFREGEKISFTDLELQLMLLTTAVFAHQLFSAVATYARRLQEEG